MKKLMVAFLFTLALTPCPPVRAQISPMDFSWNFNGLGLVNFAQLQMDSLEVMNPTAQPDPGVSLRYRPDPRVSARVRQQFADQLVRAANASGNRARQLRQGVEQSFAPANLARLAQSLFAREQFVVTDMADSTAMLVIGCFFVKQRMQEGTVEQNLGVRNQFRIAFSRASKTAGMSDAQKQHHAEASMILLAILFNEYQQLQQGTPGYTREGVENFAGQLLQLMTLDPDRYRLGSKGLERG